MLPGAQGVEAIDDDGAVIGVLRAMHPDGLFAGPVSPDVPYRLRIDWGGVIQEIHDAYSFGLILGELDLHLLGEGRHRDLGDCLGAMP